MAFKGYDVFFFTIFNVSQKKTVRKKEGKEGRKGRKRPQLKVI
jgi:hypothetical protein